MLMFIFIHHQTTTFAANVRGFYLLFNIFFHHQTTTVS